MIAGQRKEREQFLRIDPDRDGDGRTSPQPRDTFVLKRGAYDAHGDKVTPGVPGSSAADCSRSGRTTGWAWRAGWWIAAIR